MAEQDPVQRDGRWPGLQQVQLVVGQPVSAPIVDVFPVRRSIEHVAVGVAQNETRIGKALQEGQRFSGPRPPDDVAANQDDVNVLDLGEHGFQCGGISMNVIERCYSHGRRFQSHNNLHRRLRRAPRRAFPVLRDNERQQGRKEAESKDEQGDNHQKCHCSSSIHRKSSRCLSPTRRERCARDPYQLLKPQSQRQRGDLCLQKILIERRKALTVHLALNGEVIENVREGEDELRAFVHQRPFRREVDR